MTSPGTGDEGVAGTDAYGSPPVRGAWFEHARYFLRYALVGVANTAIYWGLYLLLSSALPYFAAHLVAFTLAMVASFFLNCHWTFRVRPTLQKFLYFPLTNVPNFLATSFGVVLLVEWLHVDESLAPLIAAVVAVPFTFVLSRTILLGWSRGAPTGAEQVPGSPSERAGRSA